MVILINLIKHQDVNFRIIRPVNDTFIGRKGGIFLDLELVREETHTLKTSYLQDRINASLAIHIGGRELLRTRVESTFYGCVLERDIFESNIPLAETHMVTIQLYVPFASGDVDTPYREQVLHLRTIPQSLPQTQSSNNNINNEENWSYVDDSGSNNLPRLVDFIRGGIMQHSTYLLLDVTRVAADFSRDLPPSILHTSRRLTGHALSAGSGIASSDWKYKNSTWQSFVSLNARRLEYFEASTLCHKDSAITLTKSRAATRNGGTSAAVEMCGDERNNKNKTLCQLVGATALTLHCRKRVQDIDNIAFVDQSLVSFESIYDHLAGEYNLRYKNHITHTHNDNDYLQHNSNSSSTRTSEEPAQAADTVIQILLPLVSQILKITRDKVWIFVPDISPYKETASVLFQYLEDKGKGLGLKFEPVFFGDPNKSADHAYVLPGVSVWYLSKYGAIASVTSSTYSSYSQNTDDATAEGGRDHVTATATHDNIMSPAMAATAAMGGPRILHFDSKLRSSQDSDVHHSYAESENGSIINRDEDKKDFNINDHLGDRHHHHQKQQQQEQQQEQQQQQELILPRPLPATEILLENYDAGRAFILLSNACILRDNDSVVLLSKPYAHSPSPVNRSFLGALEDRGFRYTGIRFIDVSSDAPGVADMMSTWPRASGMSAMSFSVSPGHIIHELEPLAQLLYMAKVGGRSRHRVPKVSSDTTKKHHYSGKRINLKEELQSVHDKYAYLAGRLERVIIAKLTSLLAGDWTTSMIGMIMSFWGRRRRREEDSKWSRSRHGSSVEGEGPAYVAPHSPPPPAVYLREHVISAMRAALGPLDPQDEAPETEQGRKEEEKEEEDNKEKDASVKPAPVSYVAINEGVCFDELLLLGRANSHVTFFGSEQIAMEFKQHVLHHLDLDDKDDDDSGLEDGYTISAEAYANHTCSVNNPSKNATVTATRNPRDRLLRVTVVLRPGPHRLITNFEAVRRLLLDSGVIDRDWLLGHILLLDQLSFREQVSLMRDTDVLLTVHGAAIMNGIFMRKGSVVMDIYNGRYLEFFFDPPLRESGVKLQHVLVYNHTVQTSDCPPIAPACLEGHIVDGTSLSCLNVRQCSVSVSLEGLHASLMEAYHHVLSVKWLKQYD